MDTTKVKSLLYVVNINGIIVGINKSKLLLLIKNCLNHDNLISFLNVGIHPEER